MILESPVFQSNTTIPEEYTAHGRDFSPPLHWRDVPAEAKDLVLICEDTDSTKERPYTHWLVYNINARRNKLPAGAGNKLVDTAEYEQGENSAHLVGYMGPNPTPGTGQHHYHFKLYALDYELNLESGRSRAEVETAMQGHILAQAECVGLHRDH